MRSHYTASESFDIAPVLTDLFGKDFPAVLGTHYKSIHCPFHEDRTASASINQYGFKCHSCSRTGDALKMIMEVRGVGFSEAKRIAEALSGGQGTAVRSKPAHARRRASSLLSPVTRHQ